MNIRLLRFFLKTILITNDDGYEAEGLLELIEALDGLAKLVVVAPKKNKSACSHSITLSEPLRFEKIAKDFYALDDGTPSDCIYLALHKWFKVAPPDLVISGINLGANMGEDTMYSGTVAGAMEAAMHGIKAIAISQVMKKIDVGKYDYSFENAKVYVRSIVTKLLNSELDLGNRKILNINIPTTPKLKGEIVTSLAHRIYGNDAHQNTDPRGKEYYWLGLHPLNFVEEENTDFWAIKNDFVSITPLKINLTSFEDISTTQKWLHSTQ